MSNMTSQIKILDFEKLRKTLDAGSKPLVSLVKEPEVVYVVMVTRDKCSSCQEQEPLFEKLAGKIRKKHVGQIEFLRVHSSFSFERKEEARQCLNAFHIAGFPTYIIAIKDSEGNILETYRSLEAPISEIERNINVGFSGLGLIRERSRTNV
jgi:thiol-disulfide isomerase/thioredoxin